jgi:hypothetical protein
MAITCFSGAEANRALIRIVQEDLNCWARTPTDVGTKTQALRFTSSDLAYNKETQQSSEIRADRMIANIIEVGASAEGAIETEFSAFSHDMFLEAFAGGTWSKPNSGASFKGAALSFTANDTLVWAGQDLTRYFEAGDIIQTAGFKNPVNNNIWEVDAIVFGGGNTTITLVETTAAVEAGLASGRVFDANDTVIYRNTDIRTGTGGASTIDSDGNNAFTAAVAAGELVVGQRIYLAGLGHETGTFVSAGNVTDGEYVTLFDGENTVVFEFDNDNASTRGRERVTIGVNEDATMLALTEAINLLYWSGRIWIGAKFDAGTNTITLTNYRAANGGTLTENTATITVTNFAGGAAANHGYFTVTSVSNDVIGVTPNPGTNANAGGLAVTIKGSHLRNPGDPTAIVKRSFTMETHFTDVNQVFVTKGLRIGSFEFAAAAGDIVTASYELMGQGITTHSNTVLGSAPYVPLATNSSEPFNATVGVGAIRKDGAPFDVAIQSIELNGDGNMRSQTAAGNKFPIGIAYGSLSIEGSMVVYFADLQVFDLLLSHATLSLSFDFSDVDGNAYTFTLPAVKITNDVIVPEGINTDIMEEVEFQAQRDPVLSTMFMVDRFSVTRPAQG